MKHIFTLLTAVFMMLTAVAQDDYINMSYCGDNIQYSVALNNGVPTKAAIAITRGMLGIYRDAEIVGVRVGLAAAATSVSGWLVEGSDPGKSVSATSPIYANRDQGWTNLIFRTPYTFAPTQGDDATIILGYTSTGTNQVGFDGEGPVYDSGNYMWTSQRGWGSVAKTCRENGYGNVCIQVLLGGSSLPTADMAVASILTRHVEQGKSYTLSGTVHNVVPTPVTWYSLSVSIDGQEVMTRRMVQPVNHGTDAEFALELPAIAEAGMHQVSVSILDVNGEADANLADNTLTAEIECVEAGGYFPQVHVIEETTNIDCGFCPRGIVVMNSMLERHPGRFIGIAAHSDVTSQNDPYYVPAYYETLYRYFVDSSMSISEPQGVMNRDERLAGDPLRWDGYYDAHADDLSEAGLRLLSVGAVDDNLIPVEIETTFRHDHPSHSYYHAFVLLEDGLVATQTNYYSSGAYGTMGGWESLPAYAPTRLNHVARAYWSYADGATLPAQLAPRTPTVSEVALQISASDYTKADNLSLVALLIDGQTGRIIQADKLALGARASGITPPIAGEEGGAGRYDLNGRPAPRTHSGIAIEGSRKVIR